MEVRTRSDVDGATHLPRSDRREFIRVTLEGTLGIPFTRGNRIHVLRNGVEIFPAMLGAIERAQRTIELLTFVYWTGDIATRFAHALAERARAGVTVKLLLDGWGARPMDDALVRQMEDAGVEVAWFRPVSTWKLWRLDNRTHRKVLIVDGEVAFTGGVGIAAEWEGDARDPSEWRDTHFQVEGPAVHGLEAAFLGNWQETGRPVPFHLEDIPQHPTVGDVDVQVLRATASIGFSDITTLMRVMPAIARERLRITTAYFAPDETSIRILREAAERGVEVDVLLPGPYTDQRFAQLAGENAYRPLLEAGVRIWHYQPTMIHAKVLTVDGLAATVGSANFNHRSMRHDDELCLTLLDKELVRILDRQFEMDRDRAREIRLKRWKVRGALRRAKEAVAHPFRRQM